MFLYLLFLWSSLLLFELNKGSNLPGKLEIGGDSYFLPTLLLDPDELHTITYDNNVYFMAFIIMAWAG